MPNIDSMYKSKYIKGEELNGDAWTLTISRLAQEKMRPNSSAPVEEKWVCYVDESDRGFVLNAKRAKAIAEIVGSKETDDWAGHKIEIYPEDVWVAGQTVITIRVKAPGGIT